MDRSAPNACAHRRRRGRGARGRARAARAGRGSCVRRAARSRAAASGTGRSPSPSRSGSAQVRHFELSSLATDAGATFSPGELVSVDAARHIAYTSPGGAVPYSMLLIACGAVPQPGGPRSAYVPRPGGHGEDRAAARRDRGGECAASRLRGTGRSGLEPAGLRARADDGRLGRRLEAVDGVTLSLVTPEDDAAAPIRARGERCGARLLEKRGIAIHTQRVSAEARPGELLLVGGDESSRPTASSRSRACRVRGSAASRRRSRASSRSIAHGRVTGMPDVYAAGDITTFTVKQGGIAAQQAEAAAEAIAAAAGVELEPRPFRPVLRGLLLTGDGPRYLHSERVGGAGKATHRAALVAAGEDRRPVPRSVPRAADGVRSPGRAARGGRRTGRGGARRRPASSSAATV